MHAELSCGLPQLCRRESGFPGLYPSRALTRHQLTLVLRVSGTDVGTGVSMPCMGNLGEKGLSRSGISVRTRSPPSQSPGEGLPATAPHPHPGLLETQASPECGVLEPASGGQGRGTERRVNAGAGRDSYNPVPRPSLRRTGAKAQEDGVSREPTACAKSRCAGFYQSSRYGKQERGSSLKGAGTHSLALRGNAKPWATQPATEAR